MSQTTTKARAKKRIKKRGEGAFRKTKKYDDYEREKYIEKLFFF
jgi:hypothetical protein